MGTTANISPIYSAYGDIQGGDILGTTVAADFTGQSINNAVVFTADATNGGFIQRLRFKAIGANTTAVIGRIYYNNGQSRLIGQATTPGTPAGTPSPSGGSLLSGSYFAKVISIDGYGGKSAASGENAAAVNVTGPTGSIAWTWTASTNGPSTYRIYVGPVTNGQLSYFTTTTNSYTQTTMVGTRDNVTAAVSNNNALIGEIALPITSVTAGGSTPGPDIDYPLNFALPPGGRILVGLSANPGVGWLVTAIGGEY